MVICTYFVNNMCRFGNKCNNEHVNVRLTVKTDVESALKGNQWPLSCYGPFREKPCVPDFVEDKSFEEIRALCYEAKTTGNIHVMDQQLKQQIVDAKTKSNMLFNLTNDALAVIVNLYNNSENGSNAGGQVANPFAVNVKANAQSGNSIFGGGNPVNNNNNMGGNESLFGNSASSNPFANAGGFSGQNQNAASIFGGGSANAVGTSITNANNGISGGSLFGSSATFGASGGSLFANNQAKPSVFGGSANTNMGPFSQPSIGGPFSLGQMGQQQQQAQQQQASSIFGKTQANQSSVFGGPATFSSKPTGLFGQANAALEANLPTQYSYLQQQAQPTHFQHTTRKNFLPDDRSVFNTTHIFDETTANIGQQQGGPLSQQQQQQQPNNLFSSSSAFGGGSSIFGGSQSQVQQQNQTQMNPIASNASSIFGSAQGMQSMQQPTQEIANPLSLQHQQQSIFGGSVFAKNVANEPAPSVFGNQNFQYQSQPPQQQHQSYGHPGLDMSALYSKIDELSPIDIECFRADKFQLGKIPSIPPPRELCA